MGVKVALDSEHSYFHGKPLTARTRRNTKVNPRRQRRSRMPGRDTHEFHLNAKGYLSRTDLPASRLQHVGLVERRNCQSLHRTDQILTDFK